MNSLRAPFGIFYISIIVRYKITHTLLKKALKSVFILLSNFLKLKKKLESSRSKQFLKETDSINDQRHKQFILLTHIATKRTSSVPIASKRFEHLNKGNYNNTDGTVDRYNYIVSTINKKRQQL